MLHVYMPSLACLLACALSEMNRHCRLPPPPSICRKDRKREEKKKEEKETSYLSQSMSLSLCVCSMPPNARAFNCTVKVYRNENPEVKKEKK
ncbi:hypothetical protein QBC39DRAFT_359981 [Podospora conica]|nr:hypothetical protein QBC39DRAFT_359981 [Schizothecium conicum]